MKYLFIIAALFSLSSCFKTDTSGNAFLFEDGNNAQLTVSFSNLNATSLYYGSNGDYDGTIGNVTPYSNSGRWCLENIYYNLESGTDAGSIYWEIYINGSSDAIPYYNGDQIGKDLYDGDNLVIFMSCASCSSATGSFTLRMNNCNN